MSCQVFSEIHKSLIGNYDLLIMLCVTSNISELPQEGVNSVMVRVPERLKIVSKICGPRRVTQHFGGHKFELWDPCSRSFEIVHAGLLKKTSAEPEYSKPPTVETFETGTTTRLVSAGSYTYHLPSRQ